MDATAQDNRLRKFATFFKSYMGVMPLVTAAVAPLLTMLKAIPVFNADKSTLATYSGLLGFLMVAWVFYSRSMFVPLMVPTERPSTKLVRSQLSGATITLFSVYRSLLANFLPLFLILASIMCYMNYLQDLDAIVANRLIGGGASVSAVLQHFGENEMIPHRASLQAEYLGIFLFAEAAFVLMALREYAYGILHISEEQVLGEMVTTKKVSLNSSEPDHPQKPAKA